MQNGIHTLRASHAFIEVEVHIDGKRVGGNEAFMRLQVDLCCMDVLVILGYASDYSPLPDNCKVILLCIKINDTIHGKSIADVKIDKDCFAFLDFPISVPLAEVPTKRFVFKCYRPIEERRPRANVVVVLMASELLTHVHPVRKR